MTPYLVDSADSYTHSSTVSSTPITGSTMFLKIWPRPPRRH